MKNTVILASFAVFFMVACATTAIPQPQSQTRAPASAVEVPKPLQNLSITLDINEKGALIISNNRGDSANLSSTAYLLNQLHDLLLLKQLQAAKAVYGVYK